MFESYEFVVFEYRTHKFLNLLLLAMESLNEFQKRQLFGQFYEKIYKKESHSLGTLSKWDSKDDLKTYNIINCIENNLSLRRSNGSGRKAIKMIRKKIESLINSLDGKKGISQKRKAQKYNISQSYVSKILRWAGVKYCKRRIKPKTSQEQDIVIKRD